MHGRKRAPRYTFPVRNPNYVVRDPPDSNWAGRCRAQVATSIPRQNSMVEVLFCGVVRTIVSLIIRYGLTHVIVSSERA